ncbi:hypothetical protein DFH28DRAFT_992398 [Melampsora americana]|nr:hypothetical protein DFH28DRAFT_992398 [Melampsora americana]
MYMDSFFSFFLSFLGIGSVFLLYCIVFFLIIFRFFFILLLFDCIQIILGHFSSLFSLFFKLFIYIKSIGHNLFLNFSVFFNYIILYTPL